MAGSTSFGGCCCGEPCDGKGTLRVYVTSTPGSAGMWFCGMTVRYQGPGGIDVTRPITCAAGGDVAVPVYNGLDVYTDAPAGVWTITVAGPGLGASPWTTTVTLAACETKHVVALSPNRFTTAYYSDALGSATLTIPGGGAGDTFQGTYDYTTTGVKWITCPGLDGTYLVGGQTITVTALVSATIVVNSDGCGWRVKIRRLRTSADGQDSCPPGIAVCEESTGGGTGITWDQPTSGGEPMDCDDTTVSCDLVRSGAPGCASTSPGTSTVTFS